jgi:hypothetical protein
VGVNATPFGTSYRPSYRGAGWRQARESPGRARFWVASVDGRGSQALNWSVKQGRWAVVVMRPGGSPGVSADLAAGAKLPALLWASIGVLVLGLLTLGGAAALIYFGAHDRSAPAPPLRRALGWATDELAWAPSTTRQRRSVTDAETGPERRAEPVPVPLPLRHWPRRDAGSVTRRCFRLAMCVLSRLRNVASSDGRAVTS